MATGSRSSGRVVAFDEHRGLGEVEDASGARFPFHCTAIADGTRTIAVDRTVEFRVVTGPIGTREAADLTPR
ncbi:MAG TPA: cold-shock protein [Acidimicrobiia bacterium]|nr:cold-shock protein [Acidimicrobiia bacterium]